MASSARSWCSSGGRRRPACRRSANLQTSSWRLTFVIFTCCMRLVAEQVWGQPLRFVVLGLFHICFVVPMMVGVHINDERCMKR